MGKPDLVLYKDATNLPSLVETGNCMYDHNHS